MRTGNKFFLLGLGVALGYWFLDTAVDFWLVGSEFRSSLIPQEPREAYMRTLLVTCLVAFSLYVRHSINKSEQAEGRLRILESAMQNANDLIVVTTPGLDPPDPKIVYVNDAFCRQTGYAAGELIGKTPRIFQGPKTDRRVLDQLRKDLGREQCFLGEMVNYRKDGSEYHLEWCITPVRDATGNLTHWVSIQRDVIKRKQAEAELREIREADRRQISRDLHDGALQDLMDALFSVQITSIKLKDEGMGVGLDKVADDLRRGIQGLRAAVHNLRLDDIQEKPFLHLLNSVVELLRQKAPDIEVHLDVDESFPSELKGAMTIELLRIVQEALVNTRRHSGARQVLLSVRGEGDEIHAEVADDGQGFDTGETVQGGVGLLSMEERAFRLGGDLEVRSRSGEGTTVTIQVPLSSFSGSSHARFRAYD